MKSKKIIIYIGLILLFVSTIILFNHRATRIRLSSWLARPNPSFIESNNLKKLQIEMNEANEAHFNRLFKDYVGEGGAENNEDFLEYYSENNTWKNTNLSINGKLYKIEIKSHGRNPWAHKFGDHISYDIKFKDKPFPFFSRRINLIIYNRIQLRNEIIKLISSKFNLFCPKSELVSVKIGDLGEYLYFVEERIDDDFFSFRKLPMIIFNSGIDGSLIYNGTASNNKLVVKLDNELAKRKDIDSTLKSKIKFDFAKINLAIEKKNVAELKQCIDLNYLSRLNAFRVIYGSDGHGFNSINFEMSYDTVSGLFYPLIHRDINSNILNNCKEPYTFMDSTRVNIPFWIILDSDKEFLNMTQKEIDLFLANNSDSSLSKELKNIYDYYKSSHVFEFSFINNGIDGSAIIENVNCLKKL